MRLYHKDGVGEDVEYIPVEVLTIPQAHLRIQDLEETLNDMKRVMIHVLRERGGSFSIKSDDVFSVDIENHFVSMRHDEETGISTWQLETFEDRQPKTGCEE